MKKGEWTDWGVEKRRPWQPMKSERLTSVSLSFSLSLSISLSVVSLTRIQQTSHKLSFHNRLRQVWWPHMALSIIFDFKPQRLTTAEVWSVFKTAKLSNPAKTDSSYHSTHTHFWPTFSSSLSLTVRIEGIFFWSHLLLPVTAPLATSFVVPKGCHS